MDLTEWCHLKLGYQFKNLSLLETALTHKSISNQNNERLEFLGDSILGQIISLYLYNHLNDMDEGALTRMRSHLVNGHKLAQIGQKIHLSEFIVLGQGELRSGSYNRESVIANCLEAVFGAIYLDGGIEAIESVVHSLFFDEFQNLPDPNELKDAKTKLQELLQKNGNPLPTYEVIKETGRPHQKTFTIKCIDQATNNYVTASASSIKKAEQKAAEMLLKRLDGNGD